MIQTIEIAQFKYFCPLKNTPVYVFFFSLSVIVEMEHPLCDKYFYHSVSF